MRKMQPHQCYPDIPVPQTKSLWDRLSAVEGGILWNDVFLQIGFEHLLHHGSPQRISPGESLYGGSSTDFGEKKVTESVEPSRVLGYLSKCDFWNLWEILPRNR